MKLPFDFYDRHCVGTIDMSVAIPFDDGKHFNDNHSGDDGTELRQRRRGEGKGRRRGGKGKWGSLIGNNDDAFPPPYIITGRPKVRFEKDVTVHEVDKILLPIGRNGTALINEIWYTDAEYLQFQRVGGTVAGGDGDGKGGNASTIFSVPSNSYSSVFSSPSSSPSSSLSSPPTPNATTHSPSSSSSNGGKESRFRPEKKQDVRVSNHIRRVLFYQNVYRHMLAGHKREDGIIGNGHSNYRYQHNKMYNHHSKIRSNCRHHSKLEKKRCQYENDLSHVSRRSSHKAKGKAQKMAQQIAEEVESYHNYYATIMSTTSTAANASCSFSTNNAFPHKKTKNKTTKQKNKNKNISETDDDDSDYDYNHYDGTEGGGCGGLGPMFKFTRLYNDLFRLFDVTTYTTATTATTTSSTYMSSSPLSAAPATSGKGTSFRRYRRN